jgi:hypothetical protein
MTVFEFSEEHRGCRFTERLVQLLLIEMLIDGEVTGDGGALKRVEARGGFAPRLQP